MTHGMSTPALLIAAGVNAKALSTFMGHANIAITLDLYGHLMPGSQAEAASPLDAYLVREIGGFDFPNNFP
jgi:integrase